MVNAPSQRKRAITSHSKIHQKVFRKAKCILNNTSWAWRSHSGTSAAEEQSSNVFISLILFYYKKTVKRCNVSLIANERKLRVSFCWKGETVFMNINTVNDKNYKEKHIPLFWNYLDILKACCKTILHH